VAGLSPNLDHATNTVNIFFSILSGHDPVYAFFHLNERFRNPSDCLRVLELPTSNIIHLTLLKLFRLTMFLLECIKIYGKQI
jgi:hypothetical protein